MSFQPRDFGTAGYIVGGLNRTDSTSARNMKCHVLTCRGNWQLILHPVSRHRCRLLKKNPKPYHRLCKTRSLPARLAAARSEVGAARFVGFDPTDGSDS